MNAYTVFVIGATALFLAFAGGGPASASPPPEVEMASASVPADQETAVSLAGRLGDTALSAFAFDVHYDPSVVSPVSCEPHPVAICSVETGGDFVRITGVSLYGISGDQTFGRFVFRAVGEPGEETPLTVALIDFTNSDMEDLSSDVVVIHGELVVEPAASPAPYPAGDANCDGEVTSVDGLLVLKQVAGMGDAPCHHAADVDCNGVADAVDALGILRYVAGFELQTPAGCTPIGGFTP